MINIGNVFCKFWGIWATSAGLALLDYMCMHLNVSLHAKSSHCFVISIVETASSELSVCVCYFLYLLLVKSRQSIVQ